MFEIILESVIPDIDILKAKVQNWYFLITHLQKFLTRTIWEFASKPSTRPMRS